MNTWWCWQQFWQGYSEHIELCGSDDFLINGFTIAFLNSSGTTSPDNEQLTSLVIEGSKISIHSLTRNVVHGSNKQDLEGDFMIIFLISS